MKFAHSTKNSAGVGLIEVLVATVVVAVGLLGVASLQGNLMGGSRINKTRAECQALANTKIEQLRENIIKTSYDTLANDSDSIDGVTEKLSRSWVVTTKAWNKTTQAWEKITTVPPDPPRAYVQEVNVRVCWSDGCPVTDDKANKENQCAVQSVIAFDAMGNSVMAAKGSGTGCAGSGSPSLNAESSDEITETINLPTTETPPAPGSVVTVDGKTYIVQNTGTRASRADLCTAMPTLVAFENDLYTRRVNHDGVTGDEAIELYEKAVIGDQNYCIPRVRYNGGVIIPIRGIVHSGATTGTGNNQTLLDVNLFTFNTSESGTYCVFKPEANAKSAPYVCYVGGNCQGFTGTPLSDSVTECQGSLSAAKVGPGGWRGKVGLLGVASNGNNVCFGEELTSAPATLDTARNYYARNGGLNEGINKPYSCHDFLIINGQNGNEGKVYKECVDQANAIGGFKLASKTIQRDITGDNVFDPTIDTNFCVGAVETTYTITGHITGLLTLVLPPKVTVSDGTTTHDCTATILSRTYTCIITTTATSVAIRGVYKYLQLVFQPVSCNMSLSSTTPTPDGCDLNFDSLPLRTITGRIRATTFAAANAVSLEVTDGSNSIECVKVVIPPILFLPYVDNANYACSINTGASITGLTINASAASGYAVSPATYPVTGVLGVDFVASALPTYTISGSITLGAPVDNLTSLTAAVNTGTGTCTLPRPSGGWKKSTAYNYTCTVNGGSDSLPNSLSVAISPTCSDTKSGNTNAFKQYTLSTTGVPPSTGTGQLVIPLGTVTGNQTHNISIQESTEPC